MKHGSNLPLAGRFERIRYESDGDRTDADIEYLVDDAKSIVQLNQSPDLPFDYSLNPYRGCVHGCAYCYARPTHEFLGFGPGLDFETKVVVKPRAAELFEAFLRKPKWDASPITFSGVTDCYQPVERKLQLTRQCLQVADRFGQPVSIVTKNALVERDVEVLASLASRQLVHVYLSITTLDETLVRDMEPRTSTAAARLRAVRTLSEAGVPTGVLAAPVVPGLNDHSMAAVIEAAANSGATECRYSVLRLPQTVLPVFEDWLRRVRPTEADKVIGRVRDLRGGEMNDSRFGNRMRGTGPAADRLSVMFKTFAKKFGVTGPMPSYNRDAFAVPDPQGRLF